MPQLTKTELQWLALAAAHTADSYQDLIESSNEVENPILSSTNISLLNHYAEVYRSLYTKIEQIAQSEAKIIKIQR